MADTINIGNYEVSSFKVGSSDCKIYLGDTLLYPKTPSYKLILTYNDSTEYKIECDGTTALTASEVSGGSKPSSAITSAVVNACGQASFKIDANAFYGCSGMTAITLDNAITTIGNQSFMGCSGLTSFTFPTNLKQIESSCFRLCNQITNINVPSGVTYLGSGCFADMAALTAATIPATVTGTSTNLFLRDAALNNVHFLGTTAPALGLDAFKNTGIQKIYIPDCDCYDSYAATAGMSGYTGYIYAEGTNTKCSGGHDYSKDYLTFRANGNVKFKFSGATTYYSKNDGKNWVSLTANNYSPTISSGETILWKLTKTPSSSNGVGRFTSSGSTFSAEGNVLSMTKGDSFTGYTNPGNYAFMYLFSGCTGLASAENLIMPKNVATNCYKSMFYSCSNLTKAPELPATTLANGCYYSMFMYCSNLTTAPVLPAPTLASSCYYTMFSNCTKLNNVTCLATDVSATTCTSNWLKSVSSSGTFTKAASMNNWGSGASGIPAGWTVVNYSS